MVQRKIYLFANGVTIVSDKPGVYREAEKPWPALFDGSHCSFQVPWIAVFADFLRSKGHEPHQFEFHFPDGRIGRIFRNDECGDGEPYEPHWSWKIKDFPP